MDNCEKFKTTLGMIVDKINQCKHSETHTICEEDHEEETLLYCIMEVCDQCGLVISTKYSEEYYGV